MDKKFVAKVLLRCFWYCVGLMCLWMIFFLTAGTWAYNIHGRLFAISRHDFDLVNYYGMALVKTAAIVFFLIPYIAIRMTAKKQK